MLKNKLKFITYNSKEEFFKENLDILLKDEIENEILIGNVNEFENIKLLGRVEDRKVQAIFVLNDRDGLVVYFTSKYTEVPDIVLDFFVENLLKYKDDIKQIVVSPRHSNKFLVFYTKKTKAIIFRDNIIDILKIKKIKNNEILDSDQKIIKVDKDKADLKKFVKIVKNIYRDVYVNETCSNEIASRIADVYLKRGVYILTDSQEEIYCHGVTIRKQLNSCTLGAIISPSKQRGKGYGKKFIYNLCEKLLLEGNKYIFLEINTNDFVAKMLYEKFGFKTAVQLVRITFYC